MPLPVTKALSLRATNESVAISVQISRLLRRFTPRNDISFNRSVLGDPVDPIGLQGFDEGIDLVSCVDLGIGGDVDDVAL